MNPYELMIKTNHYLIKNGKLTDRQKTNIVGQLLAAKSNETQLQSFRKGVNAPEYLRSQNQSGDERIMYPLFYVPPYNNGVKLQTVLPMSPKTHILAANSYELEILRLLYLFAPNNEQIKDMITQSLKRLKTTCFANHDCHHGECFHSAIISLRFISAVSEDIEWMLKLVKFFNKYNGESKRHSNVIRYFWLCLSELPIEIAEPEIQDCKDILFAGLKKNAPMNTEKDKVYNPIIYYIMKNCLSRLIEYSHFSNIHPYLNEKDGRLHFDIL